jgi:hypothetical protein
MSADQSCNLLGNLTPHRVTGLQLQIRQNGPLANARFLRAVPWPQTSYRNELVTVSRGRPEVLRLT